MFNRCVQLICDEGLLTLLQRCDTMVNVLCSEVGCKSKLIELHELPSRHPSLYIISHAYLLSRTRTLDVWERSSRGGARPKKQRRQIHKKNQKPGKCPFVFWANLIPLHFIFFESALGVMSIPDNGKKD